MRLLYIILPVIGLGLFGYFYHDYATTAAAREAAATALRINAERKAEAEKQAAERLAAEKQARLAEERRAEEARKEAARIAKWVADNNAIREATNAHRDTARKQLADIATLEKRLEGLRADTDRLNRETHALLLQQETHAIARRSAEIETLRLLTHLTRRAESVPLPPPAPPPVK
ncbi:MAG: hypothetical protein LBG65_08065 [Puniceicoccales bacterium]|jgi:hypothetical protein|nr:hypothetical protein [Puniceicoccales bacterium]